MYHKGLMYKGKVGGGGLFNLQLAIPLLRCLVKTFSNVIGSTPDLGST